MAIVYRYSGEEQRTVADGDNYKIEVSVINSTQWQATGKATNNLVASDHPERIVGWFTKQALNSQSGSLIEGDNTIGGGLLIGKTWQIESDGKKQTLYKNQLFYVENWWEEPWYTPGYGLLSAFYPPSLVSWQYASAGFGYDFNNRIDYYTDVVITYWHPVNGDPIYTLKIFKGNNQIFSRTENERPLQVFFRENVCPPNTCPVDCGEKICCYGRDGIAVASYGK